MRYSHLGLQFLISIGLPLAGGIWLDRKLGTKVLFTLLGLALGFAAGITAMYYELFRKESERQENGPAGKRSTGGSGRSPERSAETGPKEPSDDGE